MYNKVMDLKSTPPLRRLIYNHNGNTIYQNLIGISSFSDCKINLTKPLIINSSQGKVIIVDNELQDPRGLCFCLIKFKEAKSYRL